MYAAQDFSHTLDKPLHGGSSGVIRIHALQLHLNLIDGYILCEIILGEFVHPAIFAATIALRLLHHREVESEPLTAESPAPYQAKCLLLNRPLIHEFLQLVIILADFPLISHLNADIVFLQIERGRCTCLVLDHGGKGLSGNTVILTVLAHHTKTREGDPNVFGRDDI